MKVFLERLADIQVRHSQKVIVGSVLVTALLATGLPSIQLETDFQSSLPDDLGPIETQDKVESEFRSSSSIIILFQTNDESKEDSFVSDVRSPDMIRMQKDLEEELSSETIVGNVRSSASFFTEVPGSKEEVKRVVEASGSGDQLFNRDFTATQMYVSLEEEMSEENIRKATEKINKNLEQTPKQPGIDITVTGNPVIRTDIGDTLVDDSVTTISIASVLILGLLTLTRGRVYGPITFVPLFIGLIWTLGTMGHLGIPLTIATIALGAMILGLGVEYGSFITERIIEEKDERGSVEEALRSAVPTTGLAILGSSTTTIVGFSALLIASISFIRDLGLTLSIGIALTLVSALVITPSLILEYERWSK
ncbi:MMPL family transporter [Candidatus Nanohalobium constans]|uniref:Putative exporters of the RND superfamily n=1 Tax=Candidatus Nanohalobium constans TaxID=2565781 RepID=A0A5Q0UH15_9ARCH|nr:MMPL family transporter [Candidatus Nanohalobium constans]QGA80953.1 putative exporters of the RND superfamily [Candidatus Nanohalobium constans]